MAQQLADPAASSSTMNSICSSTSNRKHTGCMMERTRHLNGPMTNYLLLSSASATEPSSDKLSALGEGRDLCRHDDSHLAAPVRCRGERTDETDDDEGGVETVSVTVAPPRRLVPLNTQC